MAIYQKNNKFYCKFQINGERHNYLCPGATTKTEALKIENAFKYKIQQIQNGIISNNTANKTKLKTLYDLFLTYSKNNKKSYKNDIYILKVLQEHFSFNMTIDKITYKQAETFKQYLQSTGLKNATINKYLNVLKKMFNLAIAEGLIHESPLKNVKQLKEPNYKIRFLTVEEEYRLFNVINSEYRYMEPIIITALQTGMRKSEILNLKWSNVDMEYKFIELLETKNDKTRRIPISDILYHTLNNIPRINEYVFINEKTNQPYTDIHKAWYSILEKANIKNFRFHDLRHTVATRLTECNIDLVVVKEILGHSKIETTMRYAHAVPKRKIEAMEILNTYNQQNEKRIQNGHDNFNPLKNQKTNKAKTMYTSCF